MDASLLALVKSIYYIKTVSKRFSWSFKKSHLHSVSILRKADNISIFFLTIAGPTYTILARIDRWSMSEEGTWSLQAKSESKCAVTSPFCLTYKNREMCSKLKQKREEEKKMFDTYNLTMGLFWEMSVQYLWRHSKWPQEKKNKTKTKFIHVLISWLYGLQRNWHEKLVLFLEQHVTFCI